MTYLIGDDARKIIGVDYAIIWDSIADMVKTMQQPQRGPTSANIFPDDVSRLKGDIRDRVKGDRCRKLAESLASQVPMFQKVSRKLRRTWADDGGDLSIDRYLDDNEMCWRRITRPRKQAKSIRLMAEISSMGWTTDEELIMRCGTIIALAQWLEDARYDVEIIASDYSYGFLNATNSYHSYDQYGDLYSHKNTEIGTVRVKRVDEPLDIDKLAGILGSQMFGYHSLLKAVVHGCPQPVQRYWGRVTAVPKHVLKNLEIDVSVPRSVMSIDSTVMWLQETARRLGDGSLEDDK